MSSFFDKAPVKAPGSPGKFFENAPAKAPAAETPNEIQQRLQAAWATSDEDRGDDVRHIARTLRQPTSVVAANYDAFKSAAFTSAFDPVQFQKDYPELYDKMTRSPYDAGVVRKTVTEKPGVVARYLKQSDAVERFAESRGIVAPGMLDFVPGVQAIRQAASLLSADSPMSREQLEGEFKVAEEPVTSTRAISQATGLYDTTAEVIDTNSKRQAALEAHADLAMKMLNPFTTKEELDWYKNAAQDAQLSAGEGLYYAKGGVFQTAVHETVTALQQQIPIYADGLRGALIGGAGGAGGGAAAGLPVGGAGALPAAAAGTALGARLGFMAGISHASFRAGLGEFMMDSESLRTSDGEPISDQTRLAYGLLYGVLSATIESSSEILQLPQMGPLGSFIKKGGAKGFMEAIQNSPIKKALVDNLLKDIVTGAITEGGEEAGQGVVKRVAEWAATSTQAGAFEELDIPAMEIQAAEDFLAGAKGSIPLTGARKLLGVTGTQGARMIFGVTNTLMEDAAVMQSAQRVALAQEVLAESPEIGAELIKKRGGGSFFVTPEAIIDFAAGKNQDPIQVIEKLDGAAGVAKLRHAAATGEAYEISADDYDKWVTDGIAEAVSGSTTDVRGLKTPDEAAEDAPAESEDKSPEASAKLVATALNDLITQTAERWGIHAPAVVLSERARFARLPEAQQRRAYYTDSITGALNDRGAAKMEVDPARPRLARFSFPMKALNDTFGHEAGDGVLRTIAQAAVKFGGTDVTYREGNIEVSTTDEKMAKDIAQAASAALDETGRVKVLQASVLRQGTLDETLAVLGAKFNESKEAAVGLKLYPGRGQLYQGFKTAEDMKGVADRALASRRIQPILPEAKIPNLKEAFDTITYDKQTGLRTATGFREARRLRKRKFVVSMDGRQVGKIDAAFGKKATDTILEMFGSAMADAGASKFDAARQSGDEYRAQGDDEAALKKFFGGIQNLAKQYVFVTLREDGKYAILDGYSFAFGIAKDIDPADKLLEEAKGKQDATKETSVPEVVSKKEYLKRLPGFAGRRIERIDSLGNRTSEGAASREARRSVAEAWATRVGEDALVEDIETATSKAFKVWSSGDLTEVITAQASIYLDMLGEAGHQDLETVLEFLKVDSFEKITAEHRANLGKAFQAYFIEGRPPAVKLARTFQRLKLWLLEMFKNHAGVGIELTDEIRGVFDRALASEDEMSMALAAAGAHKPFFKDAKAAGATEEQFTELLTSRVAAEDRIARKTRAAMEKIALQATSAFWKAKLKEAAIPAEEQYNARPDVKAFRMIRQGQLPTGESLGGPILISRHGIRQTVGKRHKSEKMLGTAVHEQGVHPDEIATMIGFQSGKEMLEALATMPDANSWISAKAEVIARDKNPEIAKELEVRMGVAQEAFHEEGSANFLYEAWNMSRRKRGLAPILAVQLRKKAEALIESASIKGLSMHGLLEHERRSAEKAAKAATAGDFELADRHLEQQLLAHERWQVTQEAIEDKAKSKELFTKLAGTQARNQMGLGSPEYRDASDRILEIIGAKKDGDGTDEALSNVAKKLEATGKFLPGKSLQDILNSGREWKEFTVGELRIVTEALTTIYTEAKGLNEAMLKGKQMSLQGIVDMIADETASLKDRGLIGVPGAENVKGKLPDGIQLPPGAIRNSLAALRTPESFLGRLGETGQQFFMESFQKGQAKLQELSRVVGTEFYTAWKELPADLAKRRFDRLTDLSGVPLDRLGVAGGHRSRQWMWMVALNWGNLSNRKRLLGGNNWNEEQVKAWLDRNMEEGEWRYVESVWRSFDKLYPEMARVHEQTHGTKPRKIPGEKIETAFGEIQGGYFPAKYEPRASQLGQDQIAEAIEKRYGKHGVAFSIYKAFTQERAENYSDVINLDWNVVPSHVAGVLHYIAHEQFIKDAGKVISNPKFSETVTRRAGREILVQIEDWVKAVASNGSDPVPQAMAGWGSAFSYAKSVVVTNALAFSYSLAAGDLADILIPAVTRKVSASGLAGTLADAVSPTHLRNVMKVSGVSLGKVLGAMIPMKGFIDARKFGLASSELLAARSKDARRELFHHLAMVGKGSDFFTRMREEHAFFFQNTVGKFKDTVIWTAAYRDGLKAGGHDSAVQAADAVLRNVSVSHQTGDQPAFLRDKRGAGNLSIMYGYWNRLYNVQADLWSGVFDAWHDADGPMDKLTTASKTVGTLAMSLGVVAVSQVLADIMMGMGPDEDEAAEAWALRRLISAPFNYIPFASTAGELISPQAASLLLTGELGAYRKPSARSAPAAAAVDRIGRVVANLAEAAKGEKETNQVVFDALEAVGAFGRIPYLGRKPIGVLRYWATDEEPKQGQRR